MRQLKKRFYLFIFRERGRRKKGRETAMCGCTSHAACWGPGLQPRRVPWLGIEPATLWFAAHTQFTELCQPGLISSLISLLTHSLFNSLLFSLHEFEYSWVFSLRLVSSFKPLCSKKMLDIVSVFLNLLRLVLCPIKWCMFENVLCALEKNVCFASLGWKILYIYQLKLNTTLLI